MYPYEREYFVSRTRYGVLSLKRIGITLEVFPPTIEDTFKASNKSIEAYDDAYKHGVMTQADMDEWCLDNGYWSEEKESIIKGIEKDIENLQVNVFQYFKRPQIREQARDLLVKARRKYDELLQEKYSFYTNTCEYIATQERNLYLFEKSCYLNGNPYDFANDAVSLWFNLWSQELLIDSQVRDLVIRDPWRGLWVLRDNCCLLTKREGRDLTPDQKNLLSWSKTYDSVYDSPDSPGDEVIKDHDALNGWFVLQGREVEKYRKEKSEDKLLSESSKLANADEIMMMAHSKEDADHIHGYNSLNSNRVRKERLKTVDEKGVAEDLDFKDRKIQLSNQSNKQFKQKFRR